MHSAFFVQNELMPRSVCDASLIACRQASSNPLGDCAITSMLRTIDIQFLPSARSYVANNQGHAYGGRRSLPLLRSITALCIVSARSSFLVAGSERADAQITS